MSTKPRSKPLRTLLGFIIGAVFGSWSPDAALVLGTAGAFVGFASAMPRVDEEQRRIGAVKTFLGGAFLAGDIDEETHQRLLHLLTGAAPTRRDEAVGQAAPVREMTAPPAPTLPVAPTPPAPPPLGAAPVEREAVPGAAVPAPFEPRVTTQQPPQARPPRPPRRPLIDFRPLTRVFGESWRSLRADFGVQGLGSLGVLLVFTATLGFVVFAFSEVGATFRPVAELMVPVVLFGMSRFLRRRSAPFMASALEGLGGAVTPIMVFAAFTDGAPVPPDVERAGLVVALAASSLMLAGLYAWTAVRRASTPLRYLVAPLVWIAVGVVGMVFHEEASAALFALVIVAIAATPWALRLVARGPVRQAATVVIAPGLVAAYTLLLLFAFAEEWPLWPVAIGGLASILALEGVRDRVPRIWAVQAGVVAVTGLAGSASLGVGWAGAVVVGAAVVLLERWLIVTESRVVAGVFGSLAGAGLLAAATASGPLLAAGLVCGVWSHARRLKPVAALEPIPALIAAASPAVAAVALGWLTEPWIGLLAMACVTLVAAMLVRFVIADDAHLGAGVLAYAVGIGFAAAAVDLVPVVSWTGLALAIAATAVAVVRGRSDARIWLASALAVGSWFAYDAAFDLGAPVVAFGLAGAGLALVVAGLLTRGRSGGHLALAGHVMGVLAFPLVLADPARIGVLAIWLAGWMIEVAADPLPSPLQRLAGDRQTLDTSWIATAPVIAGLPLLAMAIVEEALPSAGHAGIALVLAATAVAYGVVAGSPVWRRALTWEAAGAGVAASLLSVAIAATFDPLLAADRGLQATALGAGIVGVGVTGRRVQPWMHWYAWALSLPLAMVGGLAAGVVTSDLHWVVTTWGVLASVGALIADDLFAGRRTTYQVRKWWLVPPTVLGSAAAVGGMSVGLANPIEQLWPVALAATVWTAAMAFLLRDSLITIVSWAMASLVYVSALHAAGYDPVDDPILLTWAALTLLAVSLGIARRSPLGRFDVPPFVVGLAVGALACVAGAFESATEVTWAPIGGALIVAGVVKREWLAVTPIGSILLVGAAAIAGPWWLTAALTVNAIALAGVARFQAEPVARLLQWLSVLVSGASWASLLWAIDASLATGVAMTAALSAVVAVVAAVLIVRNPDGSHHGLWTAPFVATSLLAIGVASAWAYTDEVGGNARWAVAAAALAWLVSAVVVATKLDRDELRLGAAAMLVGFMAAVGWAAEFGPEGWATWVLAGAVAVTTVASAIVEMIRRHGWREWIVVTVAAMHVAGIGLAALLLPDRSLLILALLAAGGAALVIDLIFEVSGARYMAPGLVFGAWVAFITELAAVDIQWFAPPFALAVVLDLEMLRRDRRRRSLVPVSTEEMIIVELLAIGLAIGPALAQVVFESVGYGLLAIVYGTLVGVWGVATRVRRRVLAGIGGAGLAALLMIGVPLAELLPEFRGPALWAAVFAIGAVLIAVAATLEQARRRFTELKSSFADLTDGWE